MSVAKMVEEFATVTEQEGSPKLYLTLIEEEYKEWQDEIGCGTPTRELKELSDLVYVIFGYARAMGYDLETALDRVHKNNLGRCIQPDGTILRRTDNKIIKNENYERVCLGDLV